ncbi:MAG: BamA/TamA family outer membrane protein [Cyclobacteriaceae bacterium]|nr:BamA/TamA family outer membrane protein [Cyclobacteriaceae bacterium]
MILNRKKSKYFLILVGILLQGCLGTRHLKENEQLLYKQKVTAPKNISKSKLEELTGIETNRKLLFMPMHLLVSMYYTGKRKFDPEKFERKKEKKLKKFDTKIARTTKVKRINNLQFRKQQKIEKYNDRLQNGNLFMQWGESLSIFDTAKVNIAVDRIKDYLFTNGYFNNVVRYEIEKATPLGFRLKRGINIRYHANPGTAYVIDSILFETRDTAILELLKKHSINSYLVKGERYNQENFTKERERIDLLMKDMGYYDFSRQYILYEVDTASLPDRKIIVKVSIKDPAKRGYHRKFYITEINFTTDAGITMPGINRKQLTFRNIRFQSYENSYNIKILSQRIFMESGKPYSRTTTFNTQRQLANLDVFKFVNINFDTTGGQFIANIFTSTFDRYQWSHEVGLSVTQGFPGPYYNLNFKKRNIFRGLENFEMNGRIGYEGVAAATELGSVYQSVDAGINASITFPQFLIPLRENTRYRLGKLNPRTKAQLGFNYTDRPEYQRSNTSFTYTYSWDNSRIRRFDFTFASLSIINSKLRPDFDNLLDSLFIYQGNTLKFSFDPSFVSSTGFAMSWNHNNYGNLEENSIYFRWAVESGGTLQGLYTFPIIENRNLQTFRYIRLNADVRRITILNKNTTLAFRFNAGVGYSYSDNKALPYEKYFFAGGSNSVRAWRPRRLGPGSYRPDESTNPENDGLYNYRFEVPGEILLENSVELRRKLFGFFEGAIFLDMGNVWTFKPRIKLDENDNVVENGNSQFKLTEFYKELGIGTGFGFRFNFSFLILRFDVGMKVYDPARPEGDRFVLNKIKFLGPFGVNKEPVIYNIGVGFPF